LFGPERGKPQEAIIATEASKAIAFAVLDIVIVTALNPLRSASDFLSLSQGGRLAKQP
jgi:hypothetical protein